MAQGAAAAGDWIAAERSLRRAIRLKDDEDLIHEQLAEALRKLCRPGHAEKEERRLAELRAKTTTTAPRVER